MSTFERFPPAPNYNREQKDWHNASEQSEHREASLELFTEADGGVL